MADIDAKGMKVAELSDEQFAQLRQAEQQLNDAGKNKAEIYLLAVSRP